MNNKITDGIRDYVNERDNAVRDLDLKKFKEFVKRYTAYAPACYEMPSDQVLEITMHKIAVHSEGLTPDTRAAAFKWLIERGYDWRLE